MPNPIYIILILFSSASTSMAQSKDWRKDADAYIKSKEVEGYEDSDLRDRFLNSLRQEFDNGKLSDDLTALMAILIADIQIGDAEKYYQAATKLYSQKPFHRALLMLTFNFPSDKSIEQKINTTKEAIEILTLAKQDSSTAAIEAQLDYGGLLSEAKDFEGALKAYSHAVAMAGKFRKSDFIYSWSLKRLASYYSTIGDQEKTVQFWEQAEQNELQELGVNLPYPIILANRNTPTPAESLFLDKATPLADRYRVALILQNTMFKYPYHETLAAAILQEINDTASANDRTSTAYKQFLLHKGLLDLKLANSAEAVKTYQGAWEQFQMLDKKDPERFSGLTSSLNGLGCAYYIKEEYALAYQKFNECLQMYRAIGLSYGQDYILHNVMLSLAHLDSNRDGLKKLLASFQHGTTITQDFNDRMTRYGDLMMEVGDHFGAQKFYKKAYDNYHLEEQLKYYEEKDRASKEKNEESIEENHFLSIENELLEIGPVQISYTIYPYKPNGKHYRLLLKKIAHASVACEDYANGGNYITAFINEFYTELDHLQRNSQRGTDLYEIYRLKNELFPAYDLFQNILYRDSTFRLKENRENIMRAFMYVLDSKANLQYEYRHMQSVIETSSDYELKNIYKQYQELREQVVRAKFSGQEDTGQNQLAINLNLLQAELSNRVALFDSLSKSFVSWEDVQRSLKKNEAAVEIKRFSLYENGSWSDKVMYAAYIITVDAKVPEVVYLPGNDLESRYLKYYRNSIVFKIRDTISYNQFWRPIQQKLGKQTKLYVAPDGVYNQINLNTLFDPGANTYLSDRMRIITATTTKELTYEIKQSTKIQKVKLMGRPAYQIKPKAKIPFPPMEDSPERALTREQIAAGTIHDLPGTEKEIVAIRKIMDRHKIPVTYFIGENASEDNFKNVQADIVHIATHGFWFQNSDQVQTDAMFLSGLLFSGVKNFGKGENMGTSEDGILTAYEVQGMNLDQTQLVVLSACETALGHIESGEGVYGLQRAFKIAGVDKMIMSLWKVDDEATQELFELFYSKWIGKNASLENAFYAAQYEMKMKYNEPYYWGGFILIQ